MGNVTATNKPIKPYRYGWTLATFLMMGIMVVIGVVTFGQAYNTRAISFYDDGEVYSIRYKVGGNAALPIPDKAGHTFIAWYLDEELTEPFGGQVTKNTTLYARFQKNIYTLTIVDTKNLGAEPLCYEFPYRETVALPYFGSVDGVYQFIPGDIASPDDGSFAGYHTSMYNPRNVYSSVQISQNLTLYTQYDPYSVPAGTGSERVIVKYDSEPIDFNQFPYDAQFRLGDEYVTNTDTLFMLENLYSVLPANNRDDPLLYYVFDGWTLPDGTVYRDGWGVDLGAVIKNPENYTLEYATSDNYLTANAPATKVITFTAAWRAVEVVFYI